jgi:diguanylate cyclase (GGDEF)-like protein
LLDNEINRAEREGSHLGVVLIDVDRFKSINDTYGHLVGDHVLREVAQLLTSFVRPYDAVGRLGGEEFLIVLPGCDHINAVSHAERLRHALNRTVVNTSAGPLQFTASFGVTVVGPETRVAASTAIRIADGAMYAAKRAGRDRVEFSASSAELTPA